MSRAAFRIFNGHYLCAENGGGGALNATRVEAREWETFDILDLNASPLNSGDAVNLRTHTTVTSYAQRTVEEGR